jgi:hypothetical protein
MSLDFQEGSAVNEQAAVQTCTNIVRGVSGDYRIRVSVVNVGQDAFWDWAEHYIGVHPDNLRRKLNVMKGLMAHEGKHVRISRGKIIPEDDRLNTTFNQLFQTSEDVMVHTSVDRDLPGAGIWLRECFEDFNKEGEDRNLRVVAEKTERAYGFLPRTIEYCMAMQNTWFLDGGYGVDLKPETKEALDKAMIFVNALAKRVPLPEVPEDEVLGAAYHRYAVLKAYVYPDFDRLTDMDREDATDFAYIDLLSRDEGQIYKQILELRLEPEEKAELEVLLKQAKDRQAPVAGASPPETNSYFKLDEISPGLRNKMKAGRKQLQEEQRKKIEEMARDIIKKFQDQIIKALRGMLTDPGDNPTNSEMKIILKSKAQVKKEIAEKVESTQSQKKDKEDHLKRYHRLKDEVTQEMQELKKKWKTPPNMRPGWLPHGFATGRKLRNKGAMAYTRDRRKYSELWKRKGGEMVKTDEGVLLLLDVSYSMVEIPESFLKSDAVKSIIVFAETYEARKTPYSICIYSTVTVEGTSGGDDKHFIHVVKDFGEPLTNAVRSRIGGLQGVGNTPTGWALGEAVQKISKYGFKRQIIIPITDGSSDDPRLVIANSVDFKRARNNILIPIGVGVNEERFKNEFPEGNVVKNFSELPGFISTVLDAI